MPVIIQRTIVLPDPAVHRFADGGDWHRAWAAYAGIYVFVVGDECVYVGKSHNIGGRIAVHLWSAPDEWNARHEQMHERIRVEAAAGRLEVHCYRCSNPDQAEGDVILAFSPTMNTAAALGHGGCTVRLSEEATAQRDAIIRNVVTDGTQKQIRRTVPAVECAARGRKVSIEPVSEEELVKLVNACSAKSLVGHRNRALIATIWSGGLRLSEALALTPESIESLRLDARATTLIDAWRKMRPENGSSLIFSTLAGAPIKSPYIRLTLPILAKRAKLGRRINSESLRLHHRTAIRA